MVPTCEEPTYTTKIARACPGGYHEATKAFPGGTEDSKILAWARGYGCEAVTRRDSHVGGNLELNGEKVSGKAVRITYKFT